MSNCAVAWVYIKIFLSFDDRWTFIKNYSLEITTVLGSQKQVLWRQAPENCDIGNPLATDVTQVAEMLKAF